jgi:SAM-dependent methyltransferase
MEMSTIGTIDDEPATIGATDCKMTTPVEALTINRANWDDRAAIHARDMTGTYDLAGARAGRDVLDPITAAEVGDVAGLRVLHLQCHIGTDTLSLAQRGARVTGLDFSPVAIAEARALAAVAGANATFVEGRVDDAPVLTPGPFDLVFQTWGAICWLPDLNDWARVVAAVLRPGGALYLADQHPAYAAMEAEGDRLVVTFDRQTPRDRPLRFDNPTTYTGDPTPIAHAEHREWIHAFETIIGALLGAGLRLTMLREHDTLPWCAPLLVPAADRMWRLPDGHPRFPLAFSLRAEKGR